MVFQGIRFNTVAQKSQEAHKKFLLHQVFSKVNSASGCSLIFRLQNLNF